MMCKWKRSLIFILTITMLCGISSAASGESGVEETENTKEKGSEPQQSILDKISLSVSALRYEKKETSQSVSFHLETEITNQSDTDIMEVKYRIQFFTEAGEEAFSGWEIYNGQDTPIAPGETVISSRDGRIEIPEEPTSYKVEVLEAYTAEEIPPIHLPQEGETLIQALSDEHMENMKEELPVKIQMWMDCEGALNETNISDADIIQQVVDALADVTIAKETEMDFTDHYNGMIFTFKDGAEVRVRLNLTNLEFPIYHENRHYELENFDAFWNLMIELTGD